MFDQMKDLYKMQKEAKSVKKELANIHIEAEVNGVIVVVAADQELISVDIPEELMDPSLRKKVSDSIVKAHAKALKKAQSVASEKMKGIMGGMGLPGM